MSNGVNSGSATNGGLWRSCNSSSGHNGFPSLITAQPSWITCNPNELSSQHKRSPPFLSVLFLGWIGSGGPPEKFATSYARLPQTEKANAAVRLAIEYSENTYCRPSWWTGLPQAVRDGVVASLFTMNAPAVCQRGPDGLCLDGKIFATASVSRDGGNQLR